jgi:NAD(P)-dependent dehydrogenase (short-subunit alcohol dehydrogenase family)
VKTQKIFDLTGKVIIITGSSGMLGTQYAYGLSECGANVVLADIDISKSKITEKQIKKFF